MLQACSNIASPSISKDSLNWNLAEFMLLQLKPLLQDLRKLYLAKGFAE
jgi:hypothetical protein